MMPKKLPRILLGSLFIIAGVWWIWSSQPPRVSIEMRDLNVSGLERKYRLVKPVHSKATAKLPLVVVLHGAMDTTEQMAEYTQLDSLCGKKEFALVYLEGRNLSWPPSIPEEVPDVFEPDLAFFDAVCDQMISEGIDGGRIYVVGVSQGGCMANVLAMKRNQRLAAVVVNCGWVPKPLDTLPPKTEHKCPMLYVVGSEDTQVHPESVRIGYELFNMAGHPVRYEVLPGADHGWNANYGVNEMVWEFLQGKENR